MKHLAGYDQRDAHEFLQAFLNTMKKHDHRCISVAQENSEETTTTAEEETVVVKDTLAGKDNYGLRI